MTQRYSDLVARNRMTEGRCPECGYAVDCHGGWGGPGCTLTDNGVAERIAQFRKDNDDDDEAELPPLKPSMDISDRWYPR